MRGTDNNAKDLVSTIIPVFNRSAMLEEAVESVLAQTHKPIEIVIVDDGSDDGETPLTIARLVAEAPDIVTSTRIPNSGPGIARQTGLDIARGDFVQFLDSDDLIEPRKFEWQIAALRTDPGCGVAYGQTRMYEIGATPDDSPIKRTGERIEKMFPIHLQSRWWSTSTPLYRRSVLDAAGPWSDLRNEEDWEYECRIAAQGVRLAYVEAIVSSTRAHPSARLSDNGSTDPAKLANRAEAHRRIFAHAQQAGISDTAPEMRHFARELFLLARQCGAAGLIDDSQQLFHLAREASTPDRAKGPDFRLYGLLAAVAGWKLAGQLSRHTDRMRSRSSMTTDGGVI